MKTLQNFIGGKYCASTGDDSYELIDPTSGEVTARSPNSTAKDVDDAYSAAEAATRTWGRFTPSKRQAALLKLADAIEARGADLVDAQVRNTGQPKYLVKAEEVDTSADQIRFFAGAARIMQGLSSGEYMEGLNSVIRREPIGVVGQVVPWNYPLMMAIWKIGPALAAGNTVVLKPSDTTPGSALLLAEIAAQFLPEGTFNVVLGGADTGRLIVEHPTPGLVSITGSVRAGIEVAASAAKNITRAHLELGNKAPCVVFADADLDKAVEILVESGLFNAGQDCTASNRILVEASVHTEFLGKLTEAAAGTAFGDPDRTDILYGPLNNARQLERVQGFIDRLPEYATITTGGRQAERAGYFFEPTVVDGLRQDDEAIQQEIFGPVFTLQSFASEEEAIAMANGVKYGLASSVWTSDHGLALRMSRDLDFGCVWINTHIPLVAEMPHGGFKHSGYGKDLSVYAVEEYTRIKHVMSSME